MRRRILAITALLLGFAARTAATEIGGLVLVAALALGRLVPRRLAIALGVIPALLFLAFYALATVWIVPALARPLGRVALPCAPTATTPLAPATTLTCVLNRRYITPAARAAIEQVARDLAASHPGATVRYLDAGWLYEPPHANEPQPCQATASWLRWDFLDLHAAYPRIAIDAARTGAMIRLLVASPTVRRILLEPHLQERLGVAGPKVTFAGCAVARHDDHMHVDFE